MKTFIGQYVTQCIIFTALMGVMASCKQMPNEQWKYPGLPTQPVTDSYFGKLVTDDHRIIESLDTPSVKKWLEEQKAFYSTTMARVSGRNQIKQELQEYIASSNVLALVPRAAGKKIFVKRIHQKENDQKLILTDSMGYSTIELFSTKSLSINGNHSIDYFEPSWNGNYVVMGISSHGSELSTLYILDVNTKKILADSIPGCLTASPSWLPDGSGFFYNQLKKIKSAEDKETLYENSRIKLHYIKADPKNDIEIFSKAMPKGLQLVPIDYPLLTVFPHSQKVVAFVYRGGSIYGQVYAADLEDILNDPAQTKWKHVANEKDKVLGYSSVQENLFLLKFGENPHGEIEKINLINDEHTIVFGGTEKILQGIIQNNRGIYVKYLLNGQYGLLELDPRKPTTREISLPLKGSIWLSEGKMFLNSESLYFALEGWSKELGIYLYNSGDCVETNIRPHGKYGNPDFLVSRHIQVRSHDGTMVPMSIIHHKDLKLNGENPTILFAYGAYGISLEPGFDVTQLVWFKRGGVYAMAHVRGGGEKGDEWYKAGFKATKANSWKDFNACADFLIKEQYTSSKKLAAYGISAGGIAVGRAITERPELFKAAVIQVGGVNAMRSESSLNTLTVAEFGTVKDSLESRYLYEMDVYHHIKKSVKYPSALFTAGMNDARVALWEPAKVVAKMQQYGANENVVLFRIGDEGHFGDANFINEVSDIYSFVLWQLGHPEFAYQSQ
jgi:prolyl oligopeptidase